MLSTMALYTTTRSRATSLSNTASRPDGFSPTCFGVRRLPQRLPLHLGRLLRHRPDGRRAGFVGCIRHQSERRKHCDFSVRTADARSSPDMEHRILQKERRRVLHDLRHALHHQFPPDRSQGVLFVQHKDLDVWVCGHPIPQPVLSHLHARLQRSRTGALRLEQWTSSHFQCHAFSCHQNWRRLLMDLTDKRKKDNSVWISAVIFYSLMVLLPKLMRYIAFTSP